MTRGRSTSRSSRAADRREPTPTTPIRSIVFERHLAATALRQATCRPRRLARERRPRRRAAFATADEGAELAELAASSARRSRVGVIEGAGADHFPNAQIVYDARRQARRPATRRCGGCRSVSTCRCVGCSKAIGAPTNLVPRDAIPGTGPAVLDTPVGTSRRRDLVGGLLRRPGPGCDRPRRRRSC